LADDLDATALDKNGRPWIAEEYEANDNAKVFEDAFDDEFGDLDPNPDIERISAALKAVSCEERETWLIVGQTLHNEFSGGEEGFELWDKWSQPSAKYDDADQRRVWDSFGAYVGRPRTIATLYRLAKESSPKIRNSGELRFLTTEDCRLAPSRGYVIKGLIAPGDVVCIFGAPGAGKSLIAPHIGYQVALGELAFGLRTKPGLVFYVAAEDPHGMQNRVAAITIRQGHAPNFHVVDGVTDLFDDDSPDLETLLEAVDERRPALIVIDTLAMAFPGVEENDSGSMGRVVAVARQLARGGAAVLLIHHDTKAEGSTPRGHSVLNGALDMALQVKRNNDGIVRCRLTKNRNGSTGIMFAFRIGVEELGRDEDGDPITAAITEELKGAAALPKKLSAAQQAALAILEELEAEGSVTNARWATVCTEGSIVSQSENIKSRRDCFNRARRDLAQAGLIEIDANGLVRSKSSLGDEGFLEDEDN
jgi:KaiC/GvpD/RAD55 family RecA-like ATPase